MTARRRDPDYAQVDLIDWVRLASFIDGEGCILIAHNKKANGKTYDYIRIVITNTDPRLIRWLAETFGGGVMRNPSPKDKNNRQTFKWAVGCLQAEAILLRCRPYFITKGDQADIALAFQATKQGYRRGNDIPQEIVELRKQYEAQLREVRWVHHPIDDLMSNRKDGLTH